MSSRLRLQPIETLSDDRLQALIAIIQVSGIPLGVALVTNGTHHCDSGFLVCLASCACLWFSMVLAILERKRRICEICAQVRARGPVRYPHPQAD